MLTDAYELTPLQLAMLSHALSTPGSLAYCNQFEAELHGDVDSTRLQQAWHALVQRHHILRTSFHWRDLDTPLQAVRPEASVPWRTLDWTDRPPAQQERDWAALVAEDRAQPFDFERAPLMRVLLVRRATNRWSLCWSHHHLLLDGSCLRPLLQELLALYGHPERPLPDPPQFGGYVRWRRQRGPRTSEQYWRATLAGITAATPLPWREGTEGLEPQWADQTCHGTLDAAATAALLAWCRRQRCTVAAALEAAWAVVLSRYSGEQDVVFGQTLAGRPATLPRADEILGPFINTVPVRHSVTPTTTVAELVRHAHRAQGLREAHGHEGLTDVHRWSDVAAGTPLFHSVFLVQNYRAEAPSQEADVGFTITPGALFDRTDVPLTVQFTPGPCLEIECAFDSSRLEPALVSRIPGHLTQVLAAFVRNDETPVSAIELLTAAERDQLDRFNETDAPIDVNTTLLPAIARWCRTTPEAIALRHGATAVSYEELDQRVDRLARTLRQRVPTIGRDQLVAVLAPRSYHMPLAILAAWRCGAAYVPIEPSYPADRIRSILEEARPAAVFVQPGVLDPALEAALRAQYCLLDLTQHDEVRESPEASDPLGAGLEPPRGADLAYVIFTSGSTGRPKGAMVEHTGLWNHMISKLETLHLGPTDRIAQNASHAFDISVWQFFAGLCAGATVVIYDEGTILDASGFLPRLHADRISVLEVVPSYLSVLLDQDETVPLPLLRWMLVTGEVVKPPLLAQWFARYPAVPAVNAYGPSEAADDITLHVMTAPPSGSTVPIGRAIRNFRIYICAPNGTRCPVGIPGELWVSGPGVGRGYLGDDARTSAAFGTDPFRPGTVRLYRTGDLACYADDGSLLFIGRRDYQVKIRGHRIELGDVEAAMARLDGVRDIVVVDRRDPRGAWLAAYVTSHEGARLDPDVLLRQTAQLLPAYMVPTSCTLLEALPLSPNGKVDRKRLPFVEPSAHVAPSRAPRSPHEQQLVAIWEEVLRHTPIGIDDNFFALGGDSLLAMQIVSRAARAGMALTPRLLFTAQTIAELADAVGSVATGPSDALHPPQLGPAQYEFLSAVTVDAHHHAQSVLLESDVPLHAGAVRAALAAVVMRHESLRTRFTRHGDEWRVAITDAPEFLWRTTDVPAPASPDTGLWPCDEAATSLMAAFDLTSGPLFGALHCRRADGAEALLLAAHHLVVDGMSWRTLLHDFFEAHGRDGHATSPDNGSPLAPPPPTYAEWASRQPVAGPVHTPVHTPAAGLVQDERHVVTLLDNDVGRQLAHEAHRVWRTDPTDLLVTAAVTAFATWSGTEQVAVSVESHGRGDDGRFAETVGWFTRTDRFTAASGAPPAGDADEWARHIARAMDSRAQVTHAAGLMPAATLQVNYHGQIEHVLPVPWRVRPDSPGADRSPRQPRLTPFELTAQTTARGFELHLQFDAQAHDPEAMAALVHAIGRALTELLEAVRTLPPHLTWAEVPDAQLGTNELLTLHAQGVQPPTVDDVYLLSPTQQGMLFHSVEDPSTAMYVNQLTAVLDGALDVEAFTAAWHAVARRHPALRTTFHWDGLPHPVQVVHRQATIPLAFEDWHEQSTTESEEAWRLWCEEDRARGFDLTRPPLQRLLVARVGHATFRVCWTQHHLLLDGWSAAVVLEEVLQAYLGTAPLAPPPKPYRQAVSWLAAQDRAQHRTYWQGRLADWTLRTPLPAGRAVLEGQTGRFEARELEHVLDLEATRSLQQCLLHERLTLSTVMQGVWALALARMTGETDVLFGAVVSGRPTALDGADAMIGVFINTIPVRVAVPDDSSVSEWLRSLQLQQAESEPFQYGSLAHIQQLSGAGTGAPLFDTLLNVANYRIGDALQNADAGLAISHVHAWEPNNYPLTLVVTPGETLTLTLLYDAGRFDPRTADALLHRVAHLIVRISSAPGAAVGTVSLLTAGEQQALLAATTATPQPMPPHETVWQAIAAHARSAPDRLAVYSTSARLSYRMLITAVEERATVLRARGAERNSRILVEQSRDEQLLVTMLACWRIGAVYVPMDPAWPAARRTLVTERVHAAVHVRNDTLDLPIGSTTVPALEASNGDPDDGPRRDALAYIIHTSGSTGVPKGAMLAHDGLLNHVTSMIEELALDHTSVVAQTASQGFDISLWQLCAALVAGGTTAIFEDALVLDPPALLAAMRGAGVTVMQCVPSYLRLLVDQPELPQLDRLRWMVSIGEALPPRLVERWFEACPQVPLMNAYGPTEASDSVTHHVFNGPPSTPVVPLGHPIRNMGYFLVDPAGRLCPPGVIGEIVLTGIGVGRGYLFDDERTLAAFADDPFVPDRRIYRTGDLGLIDFDGRLCFAGRRDGQVKIRGHRLEIGEIEAALDRVPGVQEAVVLAQRDVHPGAHDATVLEAFVVPTAGVSWTLEALTTALRPQLSRAAMPERLRVMPALPKLASGKVDRRALANLAPSTETVSDAAAAIRTATAASTPLEALVQHVWQTVLGHASGLDENFFATGGHSLHALQLAGALAKASGVRLDVGDIFALPTIRGQAALLEHGGAGDIDRVIDRLPDAVDYPVTPAQQRLWLASRTSEGARALHMHARFRIHGPLQLEALTHAVARLLDRHESLRTTFMVRAGTLRQRVAPHGAVHEVLTIHAHRGVVEDALSAPLPLDRGPLLRLHLWPESSGRHGLHLVLHHVIGDAHSVQVLVRDLLHAYRAIGANDEPDWEPLEVQARDVAAWLAGRAAATHAADEAYWLRVLHPRPTPLPLVRRAGGSEHPPQVARRTITIDAAVVSRLQQTARAQHTTLFTILSTAVAVALHEHTGMQDMVLGTQRSLRQHPTLHGQIGLLIDSIPLRVAVKPHDTAIELVRRVSRVVRDAITHGSIGYDRMIDLAPSSGAQSAAPLIDAVVQYVTNGEPVPVPTATTLQIEDVTPPVTTLPYPLVVEATDGIDGSLQIECSVDSTVEPAVLETLASQLPPLLEWLTAPDASPLASRPNAAPARPTRPARPRISLDLT
ncbi:amino acid adenylation domain-containing protein [Gemmatimonas sp.]|uniref:amino acid adenylation domain-containing protein n=1 Tax=Gemmatimonas sp. TaxID=1962908 RepID=UPI00391D2532